MDFKDLLLHHASELGLLEDVGLQLYAALVLLISSFSDVMDLGTYFHSVTRCEAECSSHNLPEECGVCCGLYVFRFVLRLRVPLQLISW